MIPPEGRRKCSPDVTICCWRQENHLKPWLSFCLVCRVAALLVLFAISCLTHDIRAGHFSNNCRQKKRKKHPTTVQKPGCECLKCAVLGPRLLRCDCSTVCYSAVQFGSLKPWQKASALRLDLLFAGLTALPTEALKPNTHTALEWLSFSFFSISQKIIVDYDTKKAGKAWFWSFAQQAEETKCHPEVKYPP